MESQQNEIKILQGMDTLAYVRKLKDAATTDGQLIPYQTSLSFDPQRDSDSTATKSGNVQSKGGLETDVEVEFINNVSKVADELYDSLFDGDTLEIWILHRKRVQNASSATPSYFAWYMRGDVKEDSNDNDSDDNSTRDVTFNIEGTPKRGWTKLPAEAQEELDYVFRGIIKTSEDENGNGVAWVKGQDEGKGTDPTPVSGGTLGK
ncbi:phage tail tube protein [Limosilactobacillus equigenerosi]|uniref:Phage major tail protein n=1 Tax=Limosilactobacillus equigenerosi DSM 18793 = JCM 14505 TaxID=1423742 RepID=A0A0R1UZC3_9LACO|nr:phage tail tube protein [Limosilactobacillus equigenerosi]KRL96563.1 phage major tail protein [Limosilactobacillus equigenerosi DSM 18793 = JCM 14505]